MRHPMPSWNAPRALVASARLGRALAPRLGAFVECFAAWDWDGGPGAVRESTLDWGLTWDLDATLRPDLGACHGLSRDAADVHRFAGGTWRCPR